MKNYRPLSIAGIQFKITWPDDVILVNELPHYQDFLCEIEPGIENIEITIRLELTQMPDIAHLPLLFDTAQNWWLKSSENEYFLGYRGIDPGQLRCMAQFDPHNSHVVVFCGPELLAKKNNTTILTNPFVYPLDQLLVMYVLAGRNGAVIHAAGMDIAGRGIIFPGRSGAGKSTLSRQFTGNRDGRRLSDDRMIVRKMGDQFLAFGTPWPGDEKIAQNQSAPLTGMFFIKHASTNKIKELDPRVALERLLPVTSIPWYDHEFMPPLLSFLEDMANHIPSFELNFSPTSEVVPFLTDFVLSRNN